VKRYYITDRKSAGGFGKLLAIIRDQMEMGLDYLQIREKDMGARQVFDFTLAVLEVRARTRAPIKTKVLVNTRSDVALAAGADGVHLPAAAPRESLPGLLVGRSCHTLAEVKSARADLVIFGPVFASPEKGQPVGLDALRAACGLGKPVFALGGVDWENADQCLSAGAAGVAGIRMFQNPEF
jgi:thiamine-phosphate pyrophosphorylase